MSATRIRPWPPGVEKKGTTVAFLKAYRAAFDADPAATFCAGELDGVTVVVAVGEVGEKLKRFVVNDLDGVVQSKGDDA